MKQKSAGISDLPWSLPVLVADIPETGRRFDLAADAGVRMAIAKSAGLLALPRFEATFELTRHGRDGVRVEGHISATVEQSCGLTLEPVEGQVEEDVDLVYAPSREPTPRDGSRDDHAQPSVLPETLHDGAVDLGAIATEFLILGIDPYPRKPGTAFHAPPTEENVASHPFAALAALKKGEQD